MSLRNNSDHSRPQGKAEPQQSSQLADQYKARKTAALVEQIEAVLVNACEPLMQQMYSSAEDLFYDLSKRANSNNEQNLYFESMREIRIKKGAVTQGFIDGLKQNFANITDCILNGQIASTQNHKHHRDTPVKSLPQDLAIVDREELEIEIAAKNMADRTSDLFKQEIHELRVRLDHLVAKMDITARNNPFSPQLISAAFANTCFSSLSVNTKTRLILFKVFEKHVLKQLDKAYTCANRKLIDAGVLVKLPKPTKKHAPQHSVTPEKKTTTEAQTQHAEHSAIQSEGNLRISINALNTLMSAIRHSVSKTDIHYHIYSTNPGPILATHDLANALSKKQPLVDKKIAQSQPYNYLPALVAETLKKGVEQTPRSLPQKDEFAINLVSLFFDKILQNKQLPLIAQSLICRLQIPLLKLVLIDTKFLTAPEHPARKLINTITIASAQLDSSKSLERDPLYRLIVDGIQTINHKYAITAESFESLCNAIEQQLQLERRKSSVIEQRTEQTEIGKARIKKAKIISQTTIFNKIKDQKSPSAIMDFFIDAWQQVLVLTNLKEGQESNLWLENERLISDLIWLCKPKEDERSQTRAFRLIPDVLSKIDRGLDAATEDEHFKQQQIAKVENIIFSTANQTCDEELTSITAEQLERLGETTRSASSNWEDSSNLSSDHAQQALSQTFFTQAKDLTEGTWLEYLGDDNKRILCKLSKKIDNENYIFVNRFGIKNLEKTRRALALDLQANTAKILDITPLFDRVLDDIFSQFNIKAA